MGDVSDSPVVVFAHRGASGYAPDNTLESFDLAIRMGTTALETDVKLTRDRQLVFFHDYGIGKMPFYRPVAWLSLRQIQRRVRAEGYEVPTVRETFEYYRTRDILRDILWSIDVPTHWVHRRLLWLGHQYGILDRMLFCHERAKHKPKWTACGLPGGNYVWSIRDRQINKLGVQGVVARCRALGIRTLNVRVGWLSRQLTRAVHRAGIRLFIWDAHDEARIRQALAFRPAALYSNYPDVALRIVGETVE